MSLDTALAQGVLACGGLALLAMLALHFASPEFQPSWRMISEYALGRHGWLLQVFFLAWSASSILLAVLLGRHVDGGWAALGIALLVLSAVGELLGGLFDVRHRLHGLAFALGVPAVPIAALLLGHHLASRPGWSEYAGKILAASHFTWICVVVMGVAMAVMITGFRRAGVQMGAGVPPPDSVPAGVVALAGYANRLLVLGHVGWLLLLGGVYLAMQGGDRIGVDGAS